MSSYTAAGVEPALDELINDPLIQLLIKRDGQEDVLLPLLDKAGDRDRHHLSLCMSRLGLS